VILSDVVTITEIASSAFFVAVGLGLLVRYRQVSQKMVSSSDLGKDLFQELDQRLKKQDMRILDLMGRFEVLQSRVANVMSTQQSAIPEQSSPPVVRKPDVTSAPPVSTTIESQEAVIESPSPATDAIGVASHRSLDSTQLAAINLLAQSPRTTIEIKNALVKSREHTARLMKFLFDLGLVERDASKKPFVYRLTDLGRTYLSAS